MKPTYVYIYSVQDPICIPDSNIFHPFYKKNTLKWILNQHF